MPKLIGRKCFSTKEDIEKLKQLYYEGWTYKEIGDKLGLSSTWASDNCRKLIAKGEMQKRKKKITKDIIRRGQEIPFQERPDTGKIFALLHAGWKIEDIAEDMQLNLKQVAKIVIDGEM